MTHMALASVLPAESFGERFTRARGHRGIGLREAARRVSYFVPISMSTLSRLEGMPAAPTSRRSRAVAAIYALTLGYEPAVFGLSTEDLPRSIDVDRAVQVLRGDSESGGSSGKDKTWNRWSSDVAGSAPAA